MSYQAPTLSNATKAKIISAFSGIYLEDLLDQTKFKADFKKDMLARLVASGLNGDTTKAILDVLLAGPKKPTRRRSLRAGTGSFTATAVLGATVTPTIVVRTAAPLPSMPSCLVLSYWLSRAALYL